MILDTSAIVAVIRDEPEAGTLIVKMRASAFVGIGAPTLAEAGIVLTARLGTEATALIDKFLRIYGVAVLPFGPDHWSLSVEAFRRFGKGRHPAALNFGDCMSYATAKIAEQPLLYVGADFTQTDLELA